MLEGYRLDMAGTGNLIDQLAEAKDRMTTANNALRGSTARDLGSVEIDHAGGAFQNRWGYGIGKLAGAADKMVDGLTTTRKQYQEADQATAKYFPEGDSAISRRMGGLA